MYIYIYIILYLYIGKCSNMESLFFPCEWFQTCSIKFLPHNPIPRTYETPPLYGRQNVEIPG